MASSPDPSFDVFEQLHALLHALKGRGPDSAPRRVAPTEHRVLQHIARHPGSTQGDIAERTGRDKGQINRLIQQLEDNGLLVRVPDDTDRRKLRLELTATGRDVVKELVAERRRMAARMVSDFSAAEQAQLAELLARMRANLER